MSGVVTLAERKAVELRRKQQAVATLRAELAAHAACHGGSFWLYGSAARGTMRHDSDIDLLLDFPESERSRAWGFAEAACRTLRLEADIRPLSWCDAAFLSHIAGDLIRLP